MAQLRLFYLNLFSTGEIKIGELEKIFKRFFLNRYDQENFFIKASSEYLKITNYKSLPNNAKKIISKAEYEEMRAGRLAMFENLVEMAKSKQAYEKSAKQLAEEFSKKGLKGDEYVDMMFKDQFKSPVPSGVTDAQILQGEQLLKNLKTEGRLLNATGGRVPLGGGKLVVKGGNWLIKSLLGTR